jgi:DNA-binding LacI/PurR family transcriptional regulator
MSRNGTPPGDLASLETPAPKSGKPKYLQIQDTLRAGILAGHYRNGARLPSEAELVRRFGVSRMTAVKALQHLQQEGLLVRRTGSGTYATAPANSPRPVFGLIIPDLGETEIFEPICKGMAASPNLSGHSLAWAHASLSGTGKADQAEHLCDQYIAQGVAGVFFAPLEFEPNRDAINRSVLKKLKFAKIPVVLLDRCVLEFPSRSDYDIVGLDNRRAGYIMTTHLIGRGARHIAFLAVEGSAETVEDRIAGYREALFAHRIPLQAELTLRLNPSDTAAVASALATRKIDAILCGNDLTAARLMQSLLALGVRVPSDIRLAGFDDVRYAGLLPVPLTTLHQPCLAIGAAAVAAMQDRIANPHLAARSIFLNGHVVVRRSCGGLD